MKSSSYLKCVTQCEFVKEDFLQRSIAEATVFDNYALVDEIPLQI